MDNIIDGIRDISRKLLDEKKVEVVIGFKTGTLKGVSTPCFITNSDDYSNLVWDDGCKNNLANYLIKENRKAGIIVKGCDSRSLINLLTEYQIKRDRIVIIGAPCPLTEKCSGCHITAPLIYDHLIGNLKKESIEANFSNVEEFSQLPAKERKDYIYHEVSKCIRCYACRNACPACYCKECFVESNLPKWVGKSTDLADNLIFHLTRALHVAGRCVDCGACQRACPMGVDLRLLNQKVIMDVNSLYQFESGLDLNQKLPLNTSEPKDPESFRVKGDQL